MIFKKFIDLYKSRIIQNIGVIAIAKSIAVLFSFLTIAILARKLGPENFGIFSFFGVFGSLILGFSSFGLDKGTVRFASYFLDKERIKANLFFKIFINLRMIISILICIIGLIFSQMIALYIFKKPQLILAIRFAFISIPGLTLYFCISTIMQAKEEFKKMGLLILIFPFLSLILVIGLVLLKILSLLNAIIIFTITPILIAIIGIMLLPFDFLKSIGNYKRIFLELINFSKWTFLNSILVTIIATSDLIMISYLKDMSDAGIYSAAFRVSSKVSIIIGSFLMVFLPHVSKLAKKIEFYYYIKRSLMFSLFFVLLLAPLLFFARPLILFIYGASFIQAVLVFKILLIRFLIALVSNPLYMIAYALDRPQILTLTSCIVLPILFIGYFIFIPQYGAVGAAGVLLAVGLLSSMLNMGFILRGIRIHSSKI